MRKINAINFTIFKRIQTNQDFKIPHINMQLLLAEMQHLKKYHMKHKRKKILYMILRRHELW